MKRRKRKINTKEVHEYVNDLQRISLLRDKCKDMDERYRYTTMIECMQLCLVEMQRVD